MANKDELIARAQELNLILTGEETKPELESMIEGAEPKDPNSDPNLISPDNTKEQMVPLSAVKELIAQAMAAQAEDNKPKKVKKVTEHHAHVWRLNGKWVVDFADRNYDYDKKQIIDPYIKDKIHAYQLFNQQKREFEAWIKLVFEDGTMEDIPLNRYVERRTLVYCLIVERKKVDKSYVIGEIEKKKESGDLMKGTGVMIDQEVEMHQEVFVVKTPEGKTLTLPEYVIC